MVIDNRFIHEILDREFEMQANEHEPVNTKRMKTHKNYRKYIRLIPEHLHYHVPRSCEISVCPIKLHSNNSEMNLLIYHNEKDYYAVVIANKKNRMIDGRIIQ